MLRSAKITLVLIVILAALAGPAQAEPGAPHAPGDLDYTFAGFGVGGIVPISGLPTFDPDLALQLDGKFVVAGAAQVRRYHPNGVLDTAFAADGIAQLEYPGFNINLSAVAVQADGRIAVAGTIDTSPPSFLAARLTASGALDPSFGGDGFVTTDFAGDEDIATAVAIQPDGKVVAAGTALVSGDHDFAVARYLPDGELDGTFSGDGKVTIGFGSDDWAWDLALDADGRLVLAGENGDSFDIDFAVARLSHDGTLDGSLDGDGKLTTGFGDYGDSARAVALQPDGRIVVAGNRVTEGLIARYHPNGALDASFDGDGKRIISSAAFEDVAVQPDGKIVLLGEHNVPGGSNFTVYRLNGIGALDSTFDGDGDAILDLGGGSRGRALALRPDGRILALGRRGVAPVLVQLWPDGTFDAGGQQTLGFDSPLLAPGSDEGAYALAVQPDGKLVVAGEIHDPVYPESDLALARFLPNGQPDLSFGDHGQVWFGFGEHDAANAVAIQPDGKIVVAGYVDLPGSAPRDFLVARFNADGSRDTSFGIAGYNFVHFGGGDDQGTALALAPDGKIVVAGRVWNGVGYIVGVARFNADGSRDGPFGGYGTGTTAAEWVGRAHNWVSAVVVQPGGQIVVGGHAGTDFALMRFAADGLLDGTFGSQGVTATDMGGNDALNALALGPGGRIVAAGSREVNGASDFALAQYTPDGILMDAPDGWPGGTAFVDWGGFEAAKAIDVRADGQVVAAGCSDEGFAWAQLPLAGSVVAPITGSTSFPGIGECASGVRFSGPGRLVTAGFQSFNGNMNIALARFETTVDPTVPEPAGWRLYLPLI